MNADDIMTTATAGPDPAVFDPTVFDPTVFDPTVFGPAARPTPAAARAPRMAAVIGLYYLVTMLGAGALGLVQPLLRLDPVIIELTQFGPVLGVLAVLVTWRRSVRGRAWRPPLAFGPGLTRRVMIRLLAVAAVGTGIFAAAIGAYALLGADVQYTHPGTLPHSFWLIAAAQLVGACAEESGWRCFLTPYLRTRYGVLTTGTIVGVLWGLWHVQVFGYGPAYAAAFVSSAIAISIILAVLLEGARCHHLLVAGSFHALVNLGLLLLMPEESGDLRAEVIIASACVLAALVVTGAHAARRRGRDQ